MVSQPLQVLLVNYEFPPISGGAGRGTYHLATQLVRKGHRVDVLTSRLPGQPRKLLKKVLTLTEYLAGAKGYTIVAFGERLALLSQLYQRS